MSPKTMRNWRSQGKGPVGTRRGREVEFDLQAVVDFELQQKREAQASHEARAMSDTYTITIRPHPKNPDTRLQADLLLPSPHRRARIAVPKGMVDPKDIDLWARREGKRIMAEQKLDLDDEKKEENPPKQAHDHPTFAAIWTRFTAECVFRSTWAPVPLGSGQSFRTTWAHRSGATA
jgi:hypothetical protein